MSNFISSAVSYRVIWGWLTVILTYLVCIGLSQSNLVYSHPDIFTGITYDLTILAPLFYLLIIWQSTTPKITALPVFIIGLLIASSIIPENNQTHLNFIEMVLLPIVELGVISLVVIKVRQSLREIKKNRLTNKDFYAVLKKSAMTVLNNERLGKVFATEIAMIYFALFKWQKVRPGHNQFTGFKDNGIIAVYFVLVFLVIVETFVVHLLLLKWHELTAWLIFALSIYAGIQLLGHAKALMKRFTELSHDKLILRYGLFGDAEISYDQLDSVMAFTDELKGKEVKQLKMLGGLESHNLLIELKTSLPVESVYGTKKYCRKILLQIDQRDQFIAELNNKIDEQNIKN